MKVAIFLCFATLAVVFSSLSGFSDKKCIDYYDTTDEEHQAFSKDFCRTLALSGEGEKCCYMKYKIGDKTYFNCIQMTLNQFYNIKEYKKSLKDDAKWNIKSIECDSSSYLYGSLLLLLVFLF